MTNKNQPNGHSLEHRADALRQSWADDGRWTGIERPYSAGPLARTSSKSTA